MQQYRTEQKVEEIEIIVPIEEVKEKEGQVIEVKPKYKLVLQKIANTVAQSVDPIPGYMVRNSLKILVSLSVFFVTSVVLYHVAIGFFEVLKIGSKALGVANAEISMINWGAWGNLARYVFAGVCFLIICFLLGRLFLNSIRASNESYPATFSGYSPPGVSENKPAKTYEKYTYTEVHYKKMTYKKYHK